MKLEPTSSTDLLKFLVALSYIMVLLQITLILAVCLVGADIVDVLEGS